MQMPISLVCMDESRPGDGHLCFCRKSNCNAAAALTPSRAPLLLLLSFLTLLLIEGYFRSHASIAVGTAIVAVELTRGFIGAICRWVTVLLCAATKDAVASVWSLEDVMSSGAGSDGDEDAAVVRCGRRRDGNAVADVTRATYPANIVMNTEHLSHSLSDAVPTG